MTLRDRVERLLEPLGRKLNFRFYFVRFQPYYWPIPDRRSLTDAVFSRRSDLPGVKLNEEGQFAMLDEFRSRFARSTRRSTAASARWTRRCCTARCDTTNRRASSRSAPVTRPA